MERIGPYELREELARGGMGVVFRAHDPRLDREVAIKLLLHPDPRLSARLEREARALARLRDPHVVALHAVGEHEGRPYLVLDLVQGPSLERRLAEQGPLSPAAAVALVLPLARALERAHEMGLVHRDIKPANVLLGAGDHPFLADFGLVGAAGEAPRVDPSLTAEGGMLGTPGFWAPEQARGERGAVGPWSDVYGLAATLYAALTGQPPQSGLEIDQRPRPASAHQPEVDPALDALLLRALEPDPARRTPTAAQLAVELEAWLVRRASGGPRRGRRRGLGAAAALVVLAALAAWGAWTWRAPPESGAPGRASRGLEEGERLARSCLALAARGEAREALARVGQARARDPSDPGAWYAHAVLLGSLGREQEALLAADEVLRLAPRAPHGQELRLWIRAASGDVGGARQELARLLATPGLRAESWGTIGTFHLTQGELSEARAAYDRAQAATPGYTGALLNRGVTLAGLGELDAAEADFQLLLRSTPDDGRVWSNLADLAWRRGDRPGADERYSRALGASLVGPQESLRLEAGRRRAVQCTRGLLRLLQDPARGVADLRRARGHPLAEELLAVLEEELPAGLERLEDPLARTLGRFLRGRAGRQEVLSAADRGEPESWYAARALLGLWAERRGDLPAALADYAEASDPAGVPIQCWARDRRASLQR